MFHPDAFSIVYPTSRYANMDLCAIHVIRERLFPSDPSYSAEPLSIEQARWLLDNRDAMAERLYSITPATVPYTVETDITAGTTILVPVPKPFVTYG